MPAFVAHELFGNRLFHSLELDLMELLERNPSPYFWGLQGPDLLFFRDAVKGRSPLPRYGGVMHTQQTNRLFQELGDYLRYHRFWEDYETILAYAVGFIGHYVMDSSLHPYVYWRQEEQRRHCPAWAHQGLHNLIESDMDTALYQLYKGRSIRQYRPAARLWGSQREQRDIAALLQSLLSQLYHIEVEERELLRCFGDTRRAVRLCLDRTGLLLPAVSLWERAAKRQGSLSVHLRRQEEEQDVLNLQRRPWRNLETGSPPDTRSVPQVLEHAVSQAARMAEDFCRTVGQDQPYQPQGLPSFDFGAPKTNDWN